MGLCASAVHSVGLALYFFFAKLFIKSYLLFELILSTGKKTKNSIFRGLNSRYSLFASLKISLNFSAPRLDLGHLSFWRSFFQISWRKRNLPRIFLIQNVLKLTSWLGGHVKNSLMHVFKLFQHFPQNSRMIIFLRSEPVRNKNIGHSLGNELKGFQKLLVFVKFLRVILKIDHFCAFVLLYFFKYHIHIQVSALLYFRRDCHICYWGPRVEKIA